MRRASPALILLMILACTPVPRPPAPTASELHFPLITAASYRWQATGYGRPGRAIGLDPELHRHSLWSYTWGPGNCLYDIPMIFDGHTLPSTEFLARCAQTANVLLLFNEPEYASQAATAPETAAKALHYVEQYWPGEIWCCGNLISHPGWFDRMMAAYRAEFGGSPRLTGIHAHIYVSDGFVVEAPDDDVWLERSQAQLAAYLAMVRKWNVPARLVVSECCLLGKYAEDVYLQVMSDYMTWLRSVPEIESVAWFSARYAVYPDANLLRAGGGLTAIGEAWLAWRWR